MKKYGFVFYFLAGFFLLCFGPFIDLPTKSSSNISLNDNTDLTQKSVVRGKKVYPKTFTSKGFSPDLYLPDNPTPAVIKINEAKQAYFENRYKDACDLWHEALNLNPKHPNGIWHDIGMCNMELEKWDEAIQALTESIKLDIERFHKEQPSTYYLRGMSYLKSDDSNQSNIAAAEKDFLKTVSIDKRFYEAYHALAMIEEKRNNPTQAIFYLNQILNVRPNDAKAIKIKKRLVQQLNSKTDTQDSQ